MRTPFPVPCLLILLTVVYQEEIFSFFLTKQTLIFPAKLIQGLYIKAGGAAEQGASNAAWAAQPRVQAGLQGLLASVM